MNALFWISTLYLAEGLPYIAVNTLSVIMYKNMGISNAEIAFFTGWLYLPWVIKPFWSPFVDILRTKRWWVLFTQISIALAFGLLALLLPGSFAFKSSLIIFWIIGFLSATHDIAADGFYMKALDSSDQSFYVGFRSAFYRLATILGQGGIVMCMVRAHLVAISSVVKSPIDVDSDWLVFCIFAGEVVGFPCLYI